jgi:serine/threonine-protein kinase
LWPSRDEGTIVNHVPADERAQGVASTDGGHRSESTQPPSAHTVDFSPGEQPEPINGMTGEFNADSSLTVDVPSDPGGGDKDVVDTFQPKPAKKRKETPPAAAPPGYEILGVLGRGGMGVVYDARQVALKRRVALKMVTAGAHTGPAQRIRFQIEAEAVAALQHPNIVQIYEVGEHDGIPYFSLEYVGGGSLDRKIKHEPLPPREAAGLVQSLAVAMDYAHERGIVHRDLKPANVLMTADGLPKITDFGLAKRLDDIDSSQTQAGTILGTPSYMAPEQAEGEVKEVGTLADVYSLGAVLYQLLTGRPPFQGTTLLETLELVRTQEPVPPRQLQPKLPRDLETICLKCLQKLPAKRYINAGALATDLGHYLADEPIQARPVGRVERLWRWCYRNPGIAALTAAVFLLLATVAVTSSVMAVQIHREKAAAEEARDAAVQAKQEAEENARIATEQGHLAVNTLYGVVTKVQSQLRSQPGNQKLRQELLSDAVAGLRNVVSSAADTALFRRSRAAAFQHMGDISRELGRTDEALKHYQEFEKVIEAMSADDPGNQVVMYNRAVVYDKLGDINHLLSGDGALARDYYHKCLNLRQALDAAPEKDPEFRNKDVNLKQLLSNSHLKLGNLSIMLGDPEQAWRHYLKLLELQLGRTFATPSDALAAADSARPAALAAERWAVAATPGGPSAAAAALGPARAAAAAAVALSRQFSESLSLRLGSLSLRLDDAKTAAGWYDRALRASRNVLRRDPNSVAGQRSLATALDALGDTELQLGHTPKAKENYAQAHELWVKLAALDPEGAGPRQNMAQSHYRLGTACRRLGEAAADLHYRKCLELREALAKEDPDNIHLQVDLMVILARCGRHAEAVAQADKLRDRTPKDPAMLFLSACTYALAAEAAAQSRHGKSDDRRGAGDLEQRYINLALDTLARAIECDWRDAVALRTDPDLDPVRSQPRFQEMLQQLDQGKTRVEP